MDDITRLRQLLGVVDDRAVADDLQQRVTNAELRTDDVAEVLPNALDQARRSGRLAAALRQPIEDTLHHSIEENPRAIADVLYPVMGPAIRRSISETLNAALEGLNQGLQMGFSRQALGWRLESWRTGVPFREVVLRHTLKYRVSEAFLINKENGLLIARVGVTSDGALDRDAVAAMLTAIEDFVADSTGGEGDEGELSSAKLGDRSLWVLQGYAARLALIVDGQPPLHLRMELQDRLAFIHEHYGSFMSEFDGAEPAPEPLTEELEQCLGYESRDAEPASAGNPKIAIAVLALLAAALIGWAGWLVWQGQQEQKRWSKLRQLVADRPGVVWLADDRESQPPTVQLLVDPLADNLSGLPTDAGFAEDTVVIASHLYQSADPQIQLKRLVTAMGGLPREVEAAVVDRQIRLAGVAPVDWKSRVEAAARLRAPGIALDLSKLQTASLAAALAAELKAPAQVQIQDSGEQAIRISGLAPALWRNQARDYISREHPTLAVDWAGLQLAEQVRLEALAERLSANQIEFIDDTVVARPAEVAATQSLVAEALSLGNDCDCDLRFRAIGCSDSSGSTTLNRRLREARAQLVKQLLETQGVGPEQIEIDTQCPDLAVRAGLIEMKVSAR